MLIGVAVLVLSAIALLVGWRSRVAAVIVFILIFPSSDGFRRR